MTHTLTYLLFQASSDRADITGPLLHTFRIACNPDGSVSYANVLQVISRARAHLKRSLHNNWRGCPMVLMTEDDGIVEHFTA